MNKTRGSDGLNDYTMGSVIDYIVSRVGTYFKAQIQMTGTRATHALMGRLQELHIPIIWFRADELRANKPWNFYFFFQLSWKLHLMAQSLAPLRQEHPGGSRGHTADT
jgi:hypothetical protein